MGKWDGFYKVSFLLIKKGVRFPKFFVEACSRVKNEIKDNGGTGRGGEWSWDTCKKSYCSNFV